MSNVTLPIETTREGNKITKVCVEDVYKIMNRIIDAMDKAYNNSMKIINSVDKKYVSKDTYYFGSLIIGTGVSQPCLNDAFDEEIGNDIAFMKAKLNANIKKFNIICRIYNIYLDAAESMDSDLLTIENHILDDLYRLRQYNPEYLDGIEVKLGIVRDPEDEV